jgi:hypothetical protein
VDASYLTHSNSKSHSGYSLSFGNIGTFYSKPSKQSLISTSSTHAEARALNCLVQEIVFNISLIIGKFKPDLTLCIDGKTRY